MERRFGFPSTDFSVCKINSFHLLAKNHCYCGFHLRQSKGLADAISEDEKGKLQINVNTLSNTLNL